MGVIGLWESYVCYADCNNPVYIHADDVKFNADGTFNHDPNKAYHGYWTQVGETIMWQYKDLPENSTWIYAGNINGNIISGIMCCFAFQGIRGGCFYFKKK